jgi:hypothetical protein
LHAYGTNGLVVAAELRLTPKVSWAQLAGAFPDFNACFDFTEEIARDDSVRKRLTSCFEWPIPSYFKPMRKYLLEGQAVVFLEVDQAQLEQVKARIVAAGGTVAFEEASQEPRRGPLLSDYTWNHTTLWALKFDPSLTYLQCGFDRVKAREQLAQLKAKFGQDFLFHLEFMRMGGEVQTGSAPIVPFTTEARLREMIDFCGEIGVGVLNPHRFTLGDNGRRLLDSQVEAKKRYDPKGLLNPGKLKNYPLPAGYQPLEPGNV